jgi:hypothetical protein
MPRPDVFATGTSLFAEVELRQVTYCILRLKIT